MKHSILILLSLLAGVSCASLDETVYSNLTDDTAFTSGGNAQSAVNSIYAPLHSLYREPMFYLNDVTVDTGFKGGSPYEVMNDQGIYNDDRTLNAWNYLYQIAARANVAIGRIEAMEQKHFTKISREQLLGEAHFMRAFAYYNLTDLFCRVPLILDGDISPAAKEKAASIDKIEEQIETDLLAAKESLPKRYSSREDAGRPTYGAACGYLCRLYMRQAGRERNAGGDASGLWRDALFEANDVLSLEGSIYSLQPSVWDVFDPSTDAGLYNDELIFAIRASDKSLASGSWDLGLQFTPWAYDMGWSNILQQLEMSWWFEAGDDRLQVLQVREFPDVYNSSNQIKTYYRAPGTIEAAGTVPSVHVVDGMSYDEMVELDATYTQKYKYLYTKQYNYNTPNNFPLLRLADIILCKAEILNELYGPTAEAIALVNRIRERAFHDTAHNFALSSFPTKELLRDALCDERMYELNMECVRRPDLIRMGLWKNRMQRMLLAIGEKYRWKEQNEGRAAGYYDGSWAAYPKPSELKDDDSRQFMPIPYREVLMNPALGSVREVDAVPTPDVSSYVAPVHYGGGSGSEVPSGPGVEDYTIKWDFDDRVGWIYAPSGDAPESQCRIEDGCLIITSRAGTQDRPKYRTASKTYGAGTYTWRVLISEIEAGAQASVGAFLYSDDKHEIDFEIGYGKDENRAGCGASAGQLIACLTNQDNPHISRNTPILPGWHTFKLYLGLSGSNYDCFWYIDDTQVQHQRLNYGPETRFYIYVSMENLLFMGTHLPNSDVTAKFDYVTYKEL